MNHLPSLWGRRWVRGWARTPHGERTLEELLDLGYYLPPPPISGGARDFDGTDDKITVADSADLDLDESRSIIVQTLAFTDTVAAGTRYIATKRADTGAAGYSLLTSAASLLFTVYDGADALISNGLTLTVSTWHHCMGYVQANAAASDDVGVYRDTTQAAEVNSTVLGTCANAQPFRIGTDANQTAGRWWNGRVALGRVFTQSGSAVSQSALDYTVEHRMWLYVPPGWAPPGMSQRLQWIMWDQGSPTTATDYSGNGLHGTYTGTTYVADPDGVIMPGRRRKQNTLLRM